MFKRGWLKDQRGIEGLPMRLIIIVVIAGAVLVALLAMLGGISFNKNMDVECSKIEYNGKTYDGFAVPVDATGSEEISGISFTAHIYVYESGTNKPVEGAKVTISGAESGVGGFGSGKTDENGLAIISVSGCTLPANYGEAQLKIEVTKSGYNKFIDLEGIKIVRT